MDSFRSHISQTNLGVLPYCSQYDVEIGYDAGPDHTSFATWNQLAISNTTTYLQVAILL